VKEWRKIYSSLIRSDRIAEVSMPARWLYVCLLMAQDDTGHYPWTFINRRALAVATEWTDTETQAYGAELVSAGLCSLTDGGLIEVIGGAAKNGRQRGDRRTFLYPRSTTDIPPVNHISTSDIPPVDRDKRREEKTRDPSPHTPRRARPHEGKPQAAPAERDYSEAFENFWTLYPRKVEKVAAWKAWQTRLKAKASPEALIAAARHYGETCRRASQESRYIKHASTFLGPNEPWKDWKNGAPEDWSPNGTTHVRQGAKPRVERPPGQRPYSEIVAEKVARQRAEREAAGTDRDTRRDEP
jgi:hypothetical protein